MASSVRLVFSLREQIADQLRNDVLCGRLAEGVSLTELELVDRFGVSRTPIREALQQLKSEGLLEGRPNAGMKVAQRPPDAIRELVIPIRRSVESFALRSFFNELAPADFTEWGKIIARLQTACEARDYQAIAEHDIEFHRSIIRRANQPDLESLWGSIISRVRSHFWKTQRRNYANPLDIVTEHEQILAAFRSGDVEQAVAALEKNIE